MPPILIDKKTSTVIDGWHRYTAYERLYGPEYEIAVIAKTYRNRETMLADAVAANIGRGHDLTPWDYLRCVELAEQVGMPLETLAKLIQWRPERLVAYRDSKMGKTLDDRKLALKRSIRHRMNKPLNEAQEAANEHLSGMSPMFHINQLVTLIETDLLPDDDPNLRSRLLHLAEIAANWAAIHLPIEEPEEQKGA
jgi:hypothetical protein